MPMTEVVSVALCRRLWSLTSRATLCLCALDRGEVGLGWRRAVPIVSNFCTFHLPPPSAPTSRSHTHTHTHEVQTQRPDSHWLTGETSAIPKRALWQTSSKWSDDAYLLHFYLTLNRYTYFDLSDARLDISEKQSIFICTKHSLDHED